MSGQLAVNPPATTPARAYGRAVRSPDLSGPSPDPQFSRDLYKGTATFYDRYRPPYPEALFEDLRRRLPVSGRGRLLDLACGTGQICLPLSGAFREVVAVDQEAETIALARTKVAAGGPANVVWLTGPAESMVVEGTFELITVGNAFHRLPRKAVADRMRSWVAPGGGVALVWGETPAQGGEPWQKALTALMVEWMDRAGTTERVPSTWESSIRDDPHEQILARAGFEYRGTFEFPAELVWTAETLIGFLYSTSMLNRPALGPLADQFERDLAERLRPMSDQGCFRQWAGFSYELAVAPARG